MSTSSQNAGPFTPEQQQYLQGFVAGAEAARMARGLPTFASVAGTLVVPSSAGGTRSATTTGDHPARAEDIHRAMQDRFVAEGKKLTSEEQAKRDKNPFEMWDEMRANAAAGKFPKGTDVFLYKFHGLFYVAPAQNAFMCRLRFAGGITNSHQFRGVADIADKWGGGYADVTTRANLQIREIQPQHSLDVITALIDLGIVNRGAGADNIRNITASPTSGIDAQELIDTHELAREMHHYILNHREMYGLPRKFNIAFDGGGTIAALADTNDIGFMAVRVDDGHDVPAGVYFRMELGGITGHKDFARDCGLLLKPDQCVPVAAAVVRVFLEHGDRTDRTKARLKYVLDRFGLDEYVAKVQEHLPFPLRRFPLEKCVAHGPVEPLAHIGVHWQLQPGKSYVGVVLPVGRLNCEQMRGLARIADRYGSGTIRLTVWQNLLISDIDATEIETVKHQIEKLGLHWSATNIRAGLVACTGNAGCKYAASNTKSDALRIADYLDSRLTLDVPLNIHLTGCHHSCAQHYIGDIGLLATKVSQEDEQIEAYHVFLGGGYGDNRAIGREIYQSVAADEVPRRIEQMLLAYLAHRRDDEESFREFTRRHSTEELLSLFQSAVAAAA
ncbi:MAG: NirA family protein [Planctomycetaceae bacterium]|nr:NirA family protein [Planctomycetaceae bacterium]